MRKSYRIEYDQKGGAGTPIWFSTGTDFIILSYFSTLLKLSDKLNDEKYSYMSHIKKKIDFYNTKISDNFNSKYIINVSNKELKVLRYILDRI